MKQSQIRANYFSFLWNLLNILILELDSLLFTTALVKFYLKFMTFYFALKLVLTFKDLLSILNLFPLKFTLACLEILILGI